MPRQYFREAYIIDSKWTEQNKKQYQVIITSLFFHFKYDPRNTDKMREKAWEWHNKIVPEWAETSYAREFEPVTPSESRGIGFYYLHILVNRTLVEKVHLRRRRFGKTIFARVLSTVLSFIGGFLSRHR